MRHVYEIRGSGAGGYGDGISLWKSEERYGSGSAGIDIQTGNVEMDTAEFLTVPVDRVDELIEALARLRDEIVAEEISRIG